MSARTKTTVTEAVTAASSAVEAGGVGPRLNIPKAKCPDNQTLVQRLAEHKRKYEQSNSKLKYTLKSAMENLCKAKEPVRTFKEARQVKGIGSCIAHILFPNEDDECSAADENPAKRSRSTTTANKKGRNGVESSPQVSVSSTCSRASSVAAGNGERVKPSAKQAAYEGAVARALRQDYRGQSLQWTVVFLVDDREKKAGRDILTERFAMSNIPYEVRHLPIGDMTWVAQGRRRHDKPDGRPAVELVLGTIIERKTLGDLVSSIHGTRYAEQRMRLKESGVSQCMLLVEGELHRDATLQEANNQYLEKCHTAIWETCLHMGFQAIRTKDTTETVQVLRRLHRRILQRTFPVAFYEESLPAFVEPSADGEHRRAVVDSAAKQSQPQQQLTLNRRRRRRYQSLHELVFDTEPTPPEGMDRFVTYDELKTKIERDRESGLRTSRMLHGAMIKQVPRVDGKKASAVLDAYPTPTHLFAAYDELTSESAKELLTRDLATADPDTKCRKCTVGLQSSKNLYIAYGMSYEASNRQSYADRVRAAQATQPQHDSHDTASQADKYPNLHNFSTAGSKIDRSAPCRPPNPKPPPSNGPVTSVSKTPQDAPVDLSSSQLSHDTNYLDPSLSQGSQGISFRRQRPTGSNIISKAARPMDNIISVDLLSSEDEASFHQDQSL